MNTQQLIKTIQKAGYTLTVDAHPDGQVLCQIVDKPGADGGQFVLASTQGRTLHKPIQQCWAAVRRRQ